MMGTEVTLSAFGAELFPTAERSTASGVRSVSRDGGMVAGLSIVSVLFATFGSNWSAVAAVAGASLLVPIIVWLMFPETARRTLEEITATPSADSPPAVPKSPSSRVGGQ